MFLAGTMETMRSIASFKQKMVIPTAISTNIIVAMNVPRFVFVIAVV